MSDNVTIKFHLFNPRTSQFDEIYDLTGNFTVGDLAREMFVRDISLSDKAYEYGNILVSNSYPSSRISMTVSEKGGSRTARMQKYRDLIGVLSDLNRPVGVQQFQNTYLLAAFSDEQSPDATDPAGWGAATQLYRRVAVSGGVQDRYIGADTFPLELVCIDPCAFTNPYDPRNRVSQDIDGTSSLNAGRAGSAVSHPYIQLSVTAAGAGDIVVALKMTMLKNGYLYGDERCTITLEGPSSSSVDKVAFVYFDSYRRRLRASAAYEGRLKDIAASMSLDSTWLDLPPFTSCNIDIDPDACQNVSKVTASVGIMRRWL